MTPRPDHLPPTRYHPHTSGLRPIGLDPSGLKVGGLTYWEIKLAWFADRHLTPEQLAFVGAEDPFLDGDADRWRTDRGWKSAEDVLAGPRDEEAFERYRGVRWLVDLDGTERELSV